MFRAPTIIKIGNRYFRLVRRRSTFAGASVRRRRKTSKAGRVEYLKYKEVAREVAIKRLEYFNQFYNFKYGQVAIRNQKTRWGSCSKKGNLNFNYKIALLPPELADYLVVHELCHLGEFNHSQNFWNLVGKTLPDYRELRKKLRAINLNGKLTVG